VPENKGFIIIEVQKLQRSYGEFENETPFGDSGGEIEMADVSSGNAGDREVANARRGAGNVKRKVKNDGVDFVE